MSETKKVAYVALRATLTAKGNLTIAKAVDGERGYYPTTIELFKPSEYEDAERYADNLNIELGLTDRESARIVMQSMRI